MNGSCLYSIDVGSFLKADDMDTAVQHINEAITKILKWVHRKRLNPKAIDALGFNRGSPSWTRTNDPAVNSRMLYHTSWYATEKYWILYTLIINAYILSIINLNRNASKHYTLTNLNYATY